MSYAGRTIDSPGLHISNATSRGTYSGSELKPYTGRPGAMDAYKLPSRIGSRLIEPHHKVTQALQPAGSHATPAVKAAPRRRHLTDDERGVAR